MVKKAKEKGAAKGISEKELDKELDAIEEKFEGGSGEEKVGSDISIKASKPVAQIKKGDKVKVDGKELVVDEHYVLIDHGTTKEMAIELYDPKVEDKDYQIRYFNDQAEATIDFYELQGEIMFMKKPCKRIEW